MSADTDIVCNEAPPPAPPAAKVEVPAAAESGGSRVKLVVGLMFFLLAAGVAVAFLAMRSGRGASTATAEAVTAEGEKPDETAATAAGSDAVPAECAGEIADAQLRWYCTQLLPFAKKASADHDRIDRLEAAGKDSGGSGGSTALWVIVIGIGLLTVYNTVKAHSSPGGKPPNG